MKRQSQFSASSESVPAGARVRRRRIRTRRILLLCGVALISASLTALIFTLVFLRGSAWYAKFSAIDRLVRENFYGEVDDKALDEALFSGYLRGLGDRYATYYTPTENQTTAAQRKGEAAGVGVTVTEHPDNGSVYLLRVYDGAPAAQAGLRPGDCITAVDGETVESLGYDAAVDRLRGKAGETVQITYSRDGQSQTVVVTRAAYETQSVFARAIGDYGYLEITAFNAATVDQFKTAVDAFVEQGVKGLIFDLRGNGGGTVDSVSEMLDHLLPEGDIITVSYANGKRSTLHRSDAEEVDLPMVVLTDGQTASASELFAASIRDYQKGALIGEKTFGKGVMQRTYSLTDGSAVKFTVAKFYPKSGVNFDGVGLEPDVAVSLTDEQRSRFYFLTDEEDPVKQAALDWFATHETNDP